MVSKSYIPSDIGSPTFMQLWMDAQWTDKAQFSPQRGSVSPPYHAAFYLV